MANFSIPYTTPANYTYDADKIEIVNGIARLKLQNSLQSFSEDFADDTGFVYDSSLAEFIGGKVQQKDKRPSGATVHFNFENDQNANWGAGNLTGTLLNGATVSGGFLDLVGGSNKQLRNSGSGGNCNNFSNGGKTGTFRCLYKPNFTGGAVTSKIFEITGSGNKNELTLTHTNNYLRLYMYDKNGSSNDHLFITGNFAVAGTTYEIEVNIDCTGITRLFLDGVLIGSWNTSAIDRTNDSLGNVTYGSTLGDFSLGELTWFNTTQHTANYTPNQAITDYAYKASTVILPEMEHTLPGDLTTFVSLVTVESGSPRYTIQLARSGNYLYWNGSIWTNSDGSYAQSNDSATFNAHVDEADVSGETYGQFKVHFDNSNVQSYVDTLTANLYMDTGYLATKPGIYKTDGDSVANIEEWVNFTETLGVDNIGSVVYQLSEDAVTWKYWNGSAWVTATDFDYNTVSVVNNNINDFPAVEDKIYIKAIFISDGNQSVQLDLNDIGYVINTAPILYAGTNKNVIYNVELIPFSDCLFSDAEANIVKAEWKVEAGVYVEISQGAYSTLLEAVQAFEYAPIHSGNKNIYLKITDSYDASSEDVLVINVNQVNVTVNIQDSKGYDIPNVTFDAGDSSSSSVQSSPFTFTYDIGTWTATLSKNYFDSLSESNAISISTTEITFIMSRETNIDDLIINVDVPTRFVIGDTFIFNGQININLTNYKIRCSISDKDGNEIQLATSNTGGSDSQIEIINASTGEFVIICAKNLSNNFKNNVTIEIEVENTSGQIRTIFKEEVNFENENLTWTEPS